MLKYCFLFVLFGLLTFRLSAQSTFSGAVVGEKVIRETSTIPGIQLLQSIHPENSKTASQTLLLPFFDDFSNEALYPDTFRWIYDTLRTPYISRTMAIDPPSIGVVVLDGSNRRGSYYSLPGPNPPFPEGFADILTSQAIDLSAYGPGDNIQLSFAYQPRGLGNEPEISDSLIVYFRDTSTVIPRFVKVWSIPGSAFHTFRNVVIPVEDSLFLHDHFQFRIRNKATLSGQLDHWMLDYVFLEANRNAGDTLFDDQAISIPTPSILFPYTHLSQRQFTAFWWERFRNFGVSIRNLFNATANRTLVTNISELKHGAFLTGTVSYNLPVNLGAGPQVRAFQAFDNQPFFDYALIRHTTLLDLPDSRPENDTCRVDYPIDSLFAYDDATPEAAYGLNTGRTFAQRFELPVADSITAVHLCFIKTIYNVDIPRSFVLTIFSDVGVPGSILYEQFGSALVSDSLNGFLKISLDSAIAVERSFWVGLRQTDPEPIGLGIDYNNNNTRISWDSLQFWVPSNVGGTLMIRLNLSKGNPVPFSWDTHQVEDQTQIAVWPNPTQGNSFQWSTQNGPIHRIELYDLQGRVLSTEKVDSDSGRINLPATIDSGLYNIVFYNKSGVESKRLHLQR